jgi:TRAP-type mannitol/chloroaromatic compound transport system permease small subunit
MSEFFLNLGTGLRWLGFGALPLLLLPLLVFALPARLARPANWLRTKLDAISSATLGLSMTLAIFMVAVQLLVIIGRYMFDWSASWANDLIIYSFAAMFLLAAGSTLKHDAHVRVDILREGMSAKQRAAVDLAGLYLLLFPICLLIIWASVSPSFIRSWANFEGARESDGLPITYIFKTLVPLFAILLTLQGLSMALRSALTLRGHTDTPDAPASNAEAAHGN